MTRPTLEREIKECEDYLNQEKRFPTEILGNIEDFFEKETCFIEKLLNIYKEYTTDDMQDLWQRLNYMKAHWKEIISKRNKEEN